MRKILSILQDINVDLCSRLGIGKMNQESYSLGTPGDKRIRDIQSIISVGHGTSESLNLQCNNSSIKRIFSSFE